MKLDVYVFRSTISGLEIPIKILPDDIIVNGELRRIVRDDNGEIAEWAKPVFRYHRDCIRVTLDGKVYNKDGKIAKCGNRNNRTGTLTCNFTVKGKCTTRQVVHLIINAFDTKAVAYLCLGKEYDRIMGKRIASLGYRLKGPGNIDDMVMYNKWKNMIHRCNKEECEKYIKYKKAYLDSKTTGLFLVYEYFELWYKDNIYSVQSTNSMNIDKDILIKDNKEYNENKVLLIPAYINEYFISMNRNNNGYIINDNKYKMCCKIFKSESSKNLGMFDTPEEAHKAWAKFKTEQLHEVVLPYFIEDVIPEDRDKPMVQLIINTLKNYQFT